MVLVARWAGRIDLGTHVGLVFRERKRDARFPTLVFIQKALMTPASLLIRKRAGVTCARGLPFEVVTVSAVHKSKAP